MYCVQLNRTISLHARVQLLGTGAQFEHQLPDRAGGYPARDPRLLRRRKVTSHGISRSEAEGGVWEGSRCFAENPRLYPEWTCFTSHARNRTHAKDGEEKNKLLYNDGARRRSN